MHTSSQLSLPSNYAKNMRRLYISGIAQASLPEIPVDDDGTDFDSAVEVLVAGAQHRPGARAFQIVGGSMGELMPHGCIVLVDPNDAYNTHRPCVFSTRNGHIAKRRGLLRGRPALLSDNPEVPAITDHTGILAVGCIYAVYLRPFEIRWVS